VAGGESRSVRAAVRALSPFWGAALLAWGAAIVGSQIDWTQYAFSAALAITSAVLGVLAMLRRLRIPFGVVPGAIVFLGAVAVLRNSVGGSASGTSALAMIPVFQVALYSRSRRDLAIVVAGVGVFYLAPMLIIGPPAYPQTQYRTALLSVAVSTIIGFATQQLMDGVRRQASQARDRERMLEELTDVVHGLFDSPQPRADVCAAAKRLTGATVALLYEPGAGGELHCTAMTDSEAPIGNVVAAPRSAAREAFCSGRPLVCSEDVEASVASVELWAATGRPRSILYQPLLRQGVALGVLVIGWPDATAQGDARTTVPALLAHEAAVVIARADEMNNLAGEAQTDPLTGLPNRRAWDAQLQRALSGEGRLAIAMLDLDHFKEFNDANGHPAGDRLLKETASAWRDQLRGGDLLARLGGEEFGLLLRDCDAETALEVTERLRRLVSEERTCSAGVAVGYAGETPEEIVGRADRALYQAKAGGRDRTQLYSVI
jgi:diguanylate cyclase (GGDEF)-like protein